MLRYGNLVQNFDLVSLGILENVYAWIYMYEMICEVIIPIRSSANLYSSSYLLGLWERDRCVAVWGVGKLHVYAVAD